MENLLKDLGFVLVTLKKKFKKTSSFQKKENSYFIFFLFIIAKKIDDTYTYLDDNVAPLTFALANLKKKIEELEYSLLPADEQKRRREIEVNRNIFYKSRALSNSKK